MVIIIIFNFLLDMYISQLFFVDKKRLVQWLSSVSREHLLLTIIGRNTTSSEYLKWLGHWLNLIVLVSNCHFINIRIKEERDWSYSVLTFKTSLSHYSLTNTRAYYKWHISFKHPMTRNINLFIIWQIYL